MRALPLLFGLALGACGDGAAPYDYLLETTEYDGYAEKKIHLVIRYDQSITGEVAGTGSSILNTTGEPGEENVSTLIHLRDILEGERTFSAYWYLDVDEDDACTEADFAWTRDHSAATNDLLEIHLFKESSSDTSLCAAFDGAAPL